MNKIRQDKWASITEDNPKYAGRSRAYLAQLRYRLRRAEQGLCLVNGCQGEAPMCQRHREARRLRARERKAKNVTNKQAV